MSIREKNEIVKDIIETRYQHCTKLNELDDFIDFIFDLGEDMDSNDNQKYVNRSNEELTKIAKKLNELEDELATYEEMYKHYDIIVNNLINKVAKDEVIDSSIVTEQNYPIIIKVLKIKVRNREISLSAAKQVRYEVDNIYNVAYNKIR